ncbi:hypothetical protein CMO95_00955 [Candidatus Woesearchaeota archaeon]|nr:hypothetical protein [Candidatus Woesearchaeota archaeon]|tara:strand:+ start:291 stop:1028 length:738 start_codon:yes stop_codon:yes gene_type:complete
MKKNQKILLISQNSRYLINYRKDMYHVKEGHIDLSKIKKFGERINSSNGTEFVVIEPTFFDLIKKTKRGPQIILPKDAGTIISYSGIGAGSKVIDAGTGSGWMAAFLSRVVGSKGKVVTYEKSEQNYSVSNSNFKDLKLKNIKNKLGDVYSGIKEKNFDAIILDLAEPWKIPSIKQNVKTGGFIVCYLPQVSQIQEFTKFAESNNILIERIIEVSERPWTFDGRISRPKSQQIGHTAFLIFSRNL